MCENSKTRRSGEQQMLHALRHLPLMAECSLSCAPEAMKESVMVYWDCIARASGSGLPGLAPAHACPILPSLTSQRPRHCFRGVGVFVSSEVRYIASMSLCLQEGGKSPLYSAMYLVQPGHARGI